MILDLVCNDIGLGKGDAHFKISCFVLTTFSISTNLLCDRQRSHKVVAIVEISIDN